jgi:hypothetical protein
MTTPPNWWSAIFDVLHFNFGFMDAVHFGTAPAGSSRAYSGKEYS